MIIPGDLALEHLESMLEFQATANTTNNPSWLDEPYKSTRAVMLVGTTLHDTMPIWSERHNKGLSNRAVIHTGGQVMGLWEEALSLSLHSFRLSNNFKELALSLSLTFDPLPGNTVDYLAENLETIASSMLAQRPDMAALTHVSRVFRTTGENLYKGFVARAVLARFRDHKSEVIPSSYRSKDRTTGWDDTHVAFHAARECYSLTKDVSVYAEQINKALEQAYRLQQSKSFSPSSRILN